MGGRNYADVLISRRPQTGDDRMQTQAVIQAAISFPRNAALGVIINLLDAKFLPTPTPEYLKLVNLHGAAV